MEVSEDKQGLVVEDLRKLYWVFLIPSPNPTLECHILVIALLKF